ncbi:hypothetical protein GCM10010285_03140 [Streptomyces pseudogriseolus]|uniref:Uncharacterized protein n=1 Tax=Streptomyces pseudogriseolus TaxID=36817 RepID=A0ABQ2SH41_STREZ|nr:hypothetical protein GCM10010285_03140 [Streptomyces rubiginosus]
MREGAGEGVDAGREGRPGASGRGGAADSVAGEGDSGANPGNRLAPHPFGGQDAARNRRPPWEAPG